MSPVFVFCPTCNIGSPREPRELTGVFVLCTVCGRRLSQEIIHSALNWYRKQQTLRRHNQADDPMFEPDVAGQHILNVPTPRQLNVLFAAQSREAGQEWKIERPDGLDCIDRGWLTEDYYLTDGAKRLLEELESTKLGRVCALAG